MPTPSFASAGDLPLLAVPNASEGRDLSTISVLSEAFASAGARVLDVHSDPDHHRSVFTLTARQGVLARSLLAGARVAVERIEAKPVSAPRNRPGQHPRVGALDVMPVVYLTEAQRGAACAEALVVAHEIGSQLAVPVFLYGELARGRTRAELRRGGVAAMARRIATGELRPDFGPSRVHPTAGTTLVAAREPLVAFNLELAAPATLADAQRIAALVREGGAEGLPGVRAIGVALHERAVAQVSTNVERPLELPLRAVLDAVARHAPVACVEIVGLTPRVALEGFPKEVRIRGFDPGAHKLENALGF